MKRVFISVLVVLATVQMSFAKSDFELVRDTEILINMMRSLHGDYVDTLSSTQILRDATRGIARSLDPYTSYIDEKEMEQFEISTTGKYGGIGAIIRQNGEWVTIVQPYRGAPADRAGLKIGDRIVEVDGESAKGWTVSEVSEKLKGTPGTTLNLKIGSVLDTTKIRRVRFKRERISIPAVQYAGMISGTDSVAYLRHDDFTDGGYELMRDELLRLRDEGMKSLILDYRGNGGGIMDEATKVLSLFVPQGSEVLKIKSRKDSTSYKTVAKPLFPELPIVVLIGGSTASAAEIVSGALQDMDRAILVGGQSFGKGLVQSTIPVGYDAYLKLTTARYYIPSGRSIQAIDYSDHGEERVAGKVADSLRREFKTAGGRRVLDGGGVAPDVEVEPQYVSRFAATLYAMGIIEEWGAKYYRDNREQLEEQFKDEEVFKAWVEDFNVSSRDFLDFSAMVNGREGKIEYESATSRAMKALEKAAKDDRNSELEELLERLKEEEGLRDDLSSNLERYEAEIMQYMTSDVVMRFAYGEGVTLNSLRQDMEVQRAIELLTTDKAEYDELISGVEY
ncbi:MAG: S41 family peptidase [Rikenellaceae bacterium]